MVVDMCGLKTLDVEEVKAIYSVVAKTHVIHVKTTVVMAET